MATSISSRLARSSKKQELPYAVNTSAASLVNKLRQDGSLETVESVMHAVEHVATLLSSGNIDQIKDNILNMCQHLKVYAGYLEVIFQEQLDRAFVIFRNSSLDENLDYVSRLNLLQLIELRAIQWKGTDLMNSYYKKKAYHDSEVLGNISIESALNSSMDSMAMISPLGAPLLGPGEIMKSSGKFTKPTRIPGKNYCKDEVVIRNADSGKVNPGAKERLVQITGASESSINTAKQLIEETIRRNASPMRDPNSGVGALAGSSSSIASSCGSDDSTVPNIIGSGAALPSSVNIGGNRQLLHSLSTGDASVGEYKYTVVVRGHTVKLTGKNLELVRVSKLVLDEYFSNDTGSTVDYFYNSETLPRSPVSPQETSDIHYADVAAAAAAAIVVENGRVESVPIDSEVVPTLRRPHLKIGMSNNNNELKNKSVEPSIPVSGEGSGVDAGGGGDAGGDIDPNKKSRLNYSLELLARIAMSPYSVAAPADWQRITTEYPSIARKMVEIFDAEQYLSSRATMQHVLCTSASDESILSGSSV